MRSTRKQQQKCGLVNGGNNKSFISSQTYAPILGEAFTSFPVLSPKRILARRIVADAKKVYKIQLCCFFSGM